MNIPLQLSHPEATRERLVALADRIPGAWIGIKIAALLLVLEGQRPVWITRVLGLTRMSLSSHIYKYTNVYYLKFESFYGIVISGGHAMPRESPYKIILTPDEQKELRLRSVKYTLSYFKVIRAKMILLAAQGQSNDEIARSLSTRREVVSLWRKRFFEERLLGLEELPRPGRPRAFPPRSGHSGKSHRVRVAKHTASSPFPMERFRCSV